MVRKVFGRENTDSKMVTLEDEGEEVQALKIEGNEDVA